MMMLCVTSAASRRKHKFAYSAPALLTVCRHGVRPISLRVYSGLDRARGSPAGRGSRRAGRCGAIKRLRPATGADLRPPHFSLHSSDLAARRLKPASTPSTHPAATISAGTKQLAKGTCSSPRGEAEPEETHACQWIAPSRRQRHGFGSSLTGVPSRHKIASVPV